MKPSFYVLVSLLLVDAIAWAAYVGLLSGLGWLTAAFCVVWANKWLDASDRMPAHVTRPRARPRLVA